MRTTALFTIAIGLLAAPLAAQETKPVPKDSARVSISGCTKGYIFTAGPRSVEHPGSVDVPEGTHIRMNGPKSVIADIKAHEGSTIEITGIMLTFGTPACNTSDIPPVFAPTGWKTVALDHLVFQAADYRKEAAFYIALMKIKRSFRNSITVTGR